MTTKRKSKSKSRHTLSARMSALAAAVTRWAGGNWGFATAVSTIVIWAVTGPLFKFSDTWQLVINTGTTIITFLMVFLIQRTQNKDGMAIQLKLNELVAAIDGASNHLIDIEDLSEEELEVLHRHYQKLAALAAKELDLKTSHSVEEAETRHSTKTKTHRTRKSRDN